MHQLNSTKRARVTSNAIHLPGSRILHYVRFRYPIEKSRGIENCIYFWNAQIGQFSVANNNSNSYF
jgi:hypothetical protein